MYTRPPFTIINHGNRSGVAEGHGGMIYFLDFKKSRDSDVKNNVGTLMESKIFPVTCNHQRQKHYCCFKREKSMYPKRLINTLSITCTEFGSNCFTGLRLYADLFSPLPPLLRSVECQNKTQQLP